MLNTVSRSARRCSSPAPETARNGKADSSFGGALLRVFLPLACAQFVHWFRPIYARKPKLGDSQKSTRKSQAGIVAARVGRQRERFVYGLVAQEIPSDR